MILQAGSVTPEGYLILSNQPQTIEPIELEVELSVEEYDLTLDGDTDLELGIETAIQVIQIIGETYDGPYEVTPSQETQILPTALLTATQDITINPIPSNYGLITWDGSVLTVS